MKFNLVLFFIFAALIARGEGIGDTGIGDAGAGDTATSDTGDSGGTEYTLKNTAYCFPDEDQQGETERCQPTVSEVDRACGGLKLNTPEMGSPDAGLVTNLGTGAKSATNAAQELYGNVGKCESEIKKCMSSCRLCTSQGACNAYNDQLAKAKVAARGAEQTGENLQRTQDQLGTVGANNDGQPAPTPSPPGINPNQIGASHQSDNNIQTQPKPQNTSDPGEPDPTSAPSEQSAAHSPPANIAEPDTFGSTTDGPALAQPSPTTRSEELLLGSDQSLPLAKAAAQGFSGLGDSEPASEPENPGAPSANGDPLADRQMTTVSPLKDIDFAEPSAQTAVTPHQAPKAIAMVAPSEQIPPTVGAPTSRPSTPSYGSRTIASYHPSESSAAALMGAESIAENRASGIGQLEGRRKRDLTDPHFQNELKQIGDFKAEGTGKVGGRPLGERGASPKMDLGSESQTPASARTAPTGRAKSSSKNQPQNLLKGRGKVNSRVALLHEQEARQAAIYKKSKSLFHQARSWINAKLRGNKSVKNNLLTPDQVRKNRELASQPEAYTDKNTFIFSSLYSTYKNVSALDEAGN